MFERTDLAIRYLERASRERDVTIGALVTLADIYVREGRPDDAADMAARAAWIGRDDARVRLIEARLQRAGGQADEAAALFRALLSNPGSGDAVRIRAAYELAGILDAAGRYDEAMGVLREVKAIQRPLRRTARRGAAAHAKPRRARWSASITAGVLARWRADGAALTPPAASPCSAATRARARRCSSRSSTRTATSSAPRKRS